MADNRENPSNKIRRVSTSSKNGPRTNASNVRRSSGKDNHSGSRSSQSINTNIRRSSDSRTSQGRSNSRRNPSGQNRNIKKSPMSSNFGNNTNSSDGNNYDSINKQQPKKSSILQNRTQIECRNAEKKKRKK